MNSTTYRYSIVIPVYRNEETIGSLFEQLATTSAELDGPLEVVFVVDGSPDQSTDRIARAASTMPFGTTVVELSRNFGSFSAIRQGLSEATGDYIAVIAADLQEPPSLTREFFAALASGDYDVAVGRRSTRDDHRVTNLTSNLYWSMYRSLINDAIPPGGVDVFACTRAVADRLTDFTEGNSSLIGLLFWVGYRRTEVEYERLPRQHGRSGWTVRKKLRYLTDSVYSFTDLPIIALQVVGVIGVVTSVLLGLVVLVGWLSGAIKEAGYTPLMLTISGSTSLLLLGLGIVGTYVWRAYENTKARPIAIVMRRRVFVSTGGTNV